MKVARKWGLMPRTCIDCGVVEQIRTDNPCIRCRSCGYRAGGLTAGGLCAAKAHRILCSGCGVLFRRAISHQRRENWCSPECRRRTRNADRTCKRCGVAFTVCRTVAKGNTNASGNFCSLVCYHAWLLAGAERKAKYVPMTGPRRRAVIDGARCKRCGTGADLEVHHIIPRRVGGGEESSNLIALCRHCHVLIENITRDLISQGVEEIQAKIAAILEAEIRLASAPMPEPEPDEQDDKAAVGVLGY